MNNFAKLAIAASFALAASLSVANAGTTPSAEGAKSYIISPKNGETVSGPVTVLFGLKGMGVAPATVDSPNTGHHHLFVDRAPFGEGELGEEEAEVPIPNSDETRHFGKGQTEVTLELEPGTHTLQLVLGDKDHVAHNPPVVSEVITITVK